jgi:hypothetical protein
MIIENFKNINTTIINGKDDTERHIGYTMLENCKIIGRNDFNPNALLYNGTILVSPYDEKVMSLNKESFYDNNCYELTNDEMNSDNNLNNNVDTPVFFFIYNFDNYYHFLYDTIPYLYTYLHLKQKIINLKLLVNYPNKLKKDFYKFNQEFLEKIVNMEDLIIHNKSNTYTNIYISTSLTHGGFSNNPPRKEIFSMFDLIKSNVIKLNCETPQYIYISRRTWINKDNSNIGTDYTTRRKMMNEDLLVEKLGNLGFTEIFAENLTTDEKIKFFSNAKIVVGSIGGGMANLLFSTKKTKSIVIVTPYFLDINYRFTYSLESSNVFYFRDVDTYTENNIIPLYCRAKIINDKSTHLNKIGEIINYIDNKYVLNISNNDIVGFNNSFTYEQCSVNETDMELLDKGLNSPYFINANKLIELVIKIM